MERYKGKTILITGASSGIGEEFAYQLDKLGAILILTARSEEKLIEMASKMNNAHVITGDLSTKDFSEELYNQVKKKKLNVDILINNAGFGYSGKFLDSSMENYEEMINLNICSLVHLSHLFLKDMVQNKKGGIINISSLASFQPIPYFGIYAATKAFVTSFTLSLYEEYRYKNIHVLGVCPGYTKTNFNKRAHMSSQTVPGYLMTSKAVVQESLKAYDKGKFIIINGKINRFVKLFTSIIPRKWSLKMASSIIKKGLDNNQW
jgi:short-subunit dehydrogenase